MKTIVTAFAVLLVSIPLAAQTKAQKQATPETLTVMHSASLPANDCPIGMVANQGVWDHTIRVQEGQQEKAIRPFGQRIFLTLNDSHSAAITAATVKVHGLTGRNRVLQAAADSSANGEETKTMSITFAASQKGSVTGDLYISGFTAVNSIELLQVSYSDGHAWRIAAGGVCRVTPDPTMLIANH